jgi:hypothetical protein
MDIYCKECGALMRWQWSEGTWTPGAWVVVCRNGGTLGNQDGCLLSGRPFGPDYTGEDYARARAVLLIYRAQQGIIYRNPDGTVNEWITEAVNRGILPANWAEWADPRTVK